MARANEIGAQANGKYEGFGLGRILLSHLQTEKHLRYIFIFKG